LGGCGQKYIHSTRKTGVIARPLISKISRKTLHPQSPFAQNARALQAPARLIGVQIVDPSSAGFVLMVEDAKMPGKRVLNPAVVLDLDYWEAMPKRSGVEA
jgi:hypothetical protein